MSVYLIRAGESGPVKIGKAAQPYARLTELHSFSAEMMGDFGLVSEDSKIGLPDRQFDIQYARAQGLDARAWVQAVRIWRASDTHQRAAETPMDLYRKSMSA